MKTVTFLLLFQHLAYGTPLITEITEDVSSPICVSILQLLNCTIYINEIKDLQEKKQKQKKQEMFVKHWPPARSRWNTCLDLHLT